MSAERVGIELILSVIAWFALVLVAFFFVGPVVGIITIIAGGILFGVWLARLIRSPDGPPDDA
jgi:hypothetical protein